MFVYFAFDIIGSVIVDFIVNALMALVDHQK